MTRRNCCILASMAFCAGLLFLTTHSAARGDAPQGVVRTFGFYWLGDGDPPDFSAEESLGIVVLPLHTSQSAIVFSDCPDIDIPDALRGTVWNYQPARHIQPGGDTGGAYFWLETDEAPAPPSPGAFAFTGPDGTILDIESMRVALCNGDCCPGDDNVRWRTVESGGAPFVIVTAVFSE